MKTRKIYFIIVLFSCLHCFSQFIFDADAKIAYKELMALRLNNAEMYIAKSQKNYPKNGITLYLSNYSTLVQIFLNDNLELYKKELDLQGAYYDQLQDLSDDSPYKNFLIAESKLHWAFLKLKFGNEVSGAWDLRSAYNLLTENLKKYPNFKPQLKSLGLLHVLIGSVPSSYKWITNVVGMNGTVAQGLNEISQCAKDPNEFSFEAQLYEFLIKIYIQKKQAETIPNLEKFYTQNTDNLTLNLVLASTLLHNQMSEKAEKVLESRPTGAEYADVCVLNKLLGDCYFYSTDYVNANKQYDIFLAKYKGENYKKDVNYRKLLMQWFTTNTFNKDLINQIKTEGNAIFESDKHALKYTNELHIQHKELTKVRVYFDGGYFDKALDVLNKIPVNQFKLRIHQQEYYYRKARLLASTNDYNGAIVAYKKSIELQNTQSKAYYAPNSCLQLGYIYLDRYDKINAKAYFKKAIYDYSDHEYENSIETKAKVALSNLK